MIYYTIYKTTNLVNGKIYIGKHITSNPNDSYLGSGRALNRAIIKYGRSNFIKEILFLCENESEMNSKEKELVTQNVVENDSNYNLCPGGCGGFSKENARKGLDASLKILSKEDRIKFGKLGYAASKDKWNVKHNGSLGGQGNRGKEKSESHKLALSNSIKGKSINYPPNRKSRGSIEYQEVVCPHCNRIGKKNAMNRWHFDNCRNKIGRDGRI